MKCMKQLSALQYVHICLLSKEVLIIIQYNSLQNITKDSIVAITCASTSTVYVLAVTVHCV